MTKKLSGNGPDPEQIFQELEKVAATYPLRAFRITDNDHKPTGLYLKYVPPDSETDFSHPADRYTPAPNPAEVSPELNSLLATELDRAAHTCLPCSLLLLQMESPPPTEQSTAQISSLCWSCLEQFDLLIPFRDKTLAIILPAANSGAALKRTRAIMAAIKKDTTPAPDMRAGIATCQAANALGPAAFIEIAEQELNNALAGGPSAIHNVNLAGPEDRCQVTVEERSQLFSIFKANDADEDE